MNPKPKSASRIGVAALLACTAMLVLVGCTERTPTVPAARQLSTRVVVSAPVGQSALVSRVSRSVVRAASMGAAAGSDSLVYVSMLPGSVARGEKATVQSLATRQVVTVTMADGGFDPMPLAAAVGDTLEVEVTMPAGVELYFATVPPHRPPSLVRTDPPKGKTDVPLNTQIVIVFSDPIDPSTLSGAVQLLNGSTVVAGIVTLSPSGLIANFAPDSTLAPRTSYQLVVDTTLRNSRGESLDSAVHVVFTTGVTLLRAATFDVSAVPGSVEVGEPVPYTISAKDASGNIATDYAGTLHFASTDSRAQLPENYAFVPGDRGSHTFTVIFETAGNQTVSVTDAAINSIKGSSTLTEVVVPGDEPLGPGYFSFGYQTVNSVSAPKRFTVRNTARTPFAITSLGFTDLDWYDFQQSNDCPTVLPPGASCTVSVTFAPTEIGARVGQLLVNQIWGVSVSGASIPVLSMAVAPDPMAKSGGFLYAANAESNNVSIYGINLDGTLTPKGTVSAGTTPSALTLDPSGAFVYVANFSSDDVSEFSVSADGTLASRGRIAAGSGPLSVAVAPDASGRFGRFLYVANAGSKLGATRSTVSMYSIDGGTGALTALAPAAVDAGVAPWSVSVHPSGRYVYVASGGYYPGDNGAYSGTTVEAYGVNPNGTLTALPVGMTVDRQGFPLSSIISPTSMVFDPSGKFAILATGHGGSSYSVDGTTGALAFKGFLSKTGMNVTAAAVDPSGRFAYTTSALSRNFTTSNVISAYIIGGDGVFTPAASSPATTGLSPTAVVVDPSGRFAYVANSGSKNISAYAIDSTTGTLTLIGTTPAY